MPHQNKTHEKGINSDLANRYMPNGVDRYRLNVRALTSNGDNQGAIETVLGNTIVTFTLPTGRNKGIGWKEYPQLKKAYGIIWNENGDSLIIEFDETARIIQTVMADQSGVIFNFQKDWLITHIDIVELNKDNYLMYFTDGYVNPEDPADYNRPKKINIQKGIAYMNADYVNGYPNVSASVLKTYFYRLKRPPMTAPTAVSSMDTSTKLNNINTSIFRFRASFVYDDFEPTTLSAIGDWIYPNAARPLNGTYPPYAFDNLITVTFETGSAIVKKIRLYAEAVLSEQSDVTLSDFAQIVELDKADLGIADNTTATYKFYNNGVALPVDINYANLLFSNVPLYCEASTLIKGERLDDGNITEGFNPVDVDLKMEMTFENHHLAWTNGTTKSPLTQGSFHKSGGRYRKFIVYKGEGDQSGLSNYNSGLANEIQANGRYGMTLAVPFITEAEYDKSSGQDMSSAATINWFLFNAPPYWAQKYYIATSKNEAFDFHIQFVAQGIEFRDADGVPVDADNSTYTAVKIFIGNITGRYLTENPSSILVYEWVKGDRIRFITNRQDWTTGGYPSGIDAATYPATTGGTGIYTPHSTTGSIGSPQDLSKAFDYNDAEILYYSSNDQSIAIIKDDQTPVDNDIWGCLRPGVLFEIYRPKKQEQLTTEFSYETADEYDITTDIHGNRVHAGGVSNQIIVASTSNNNATDPDYVFQVTSGHGITAADVVKVVGENGWNVHGLVASVTATTVTITILTLNIKGSYSAGASTIYKSATGILHGGDSFRPYLDMSWAMNTDGHGGSGGGGSTVYRWYNYVECMYPTPFLVQQPYFFGRPNKVDPNFREINRFSTNVYSEKILTDTQFNGLSLVYDTSIETYEQKYGKIKKLHYRDTGLIMYQQLKVQRIPVEQIIYSGSEGQSVVGQSTTVLSPQLQVIPNAGEYGIWDNPESHDYYATAEYFTDFNRSAVCRRSQDGITNLSELYGYSVFMAELSQKVLKATTKVNAWGQYDTRFGEYVCCVSPFTYMVGEDEIEFNGVTFAFNEASNQFSTHYSYIPDLIGRNGIDIITMKDGALYTHNDGNPFEFYGVVTPPEIWAVINDAPDNEKIFLSIEENSDNVWVVTSIVTPKGQETRMVYPSNWTTKENMHYADLKMDINTPVVINPIINGNSLRDTTCLVKFKYLGTEFSRWYSFNMSFINSPRHNQE